jgi:hypothetical protein
LSNVGRWTCHFIGWSEEDSMADRTVAVPVRALYAIPEAMVLLSLSRTQIYELIRSDRLLTVTQGRRRLCRQRRFRPAWRCC